MFDGCECDGPLTLRPLTWWEREHIIVTIHVVACGFPLRSLPKCVVPTIRSLHRDVIQKDDIWRHDRRLISSIWPLQFLFYQWPSKGAGTSFVEVHVSWG